MNLLPRDDTFFRLFTQHLGLICEASELLVTGLEAGYDGVCRVSAEIKTIEHKGDTVVRQIAERLQKTILTPFDPEDVQALSTALDNVLDFMEKATFRIVAYKLDPIPSELVDLGRIVNSSCNCLRVAWENLVRRKSVIDDCIAIDHLEKEADLLERRLLRDLFGSEYDPITLLKHKELFEMLEAITDRCDDVANVLENVSVKNA